MTYPFSPVTFSGFLDRAGNCYGVTEKSLDKHLASPRGPVRVVCLERTVGDAVYQVPRPNLDDDEPIDPAMMAYLCRRLGLNDADFGYTLEA